MTNQAQQLSLFDDQPVEEKPLVENPIEEKPAEEKPVEAETPTAPAEAALPKQPEAKPSSRIAIVILNWNGATMLEHYLPGILEHSKGAEVIVADNASTDDSVKMLSRDFPDVRVIALSRNWGYAGGYNQAFKVIETTNERNGQPSPEYYIATSALKKDGWSLW